MQIIKQLNSKKEALEYNRKNANHDKNFQFYGCRGTYACVDCFKVYSSTCLCAGFGSQGCPSCGGSKIKMPTLDLYNKKVTFEDWLKTYKENGGDDRGYAYPIVEAAWNYGQWIMNTGIQINETKNSNK